MSPAGWRWPVCLLVLTCVMAGPSVSQECSAEKMENTIIDINLSLPKGIRGAEPVYAPSSEACIRVCCSGEKLSGNWLLFGLFCYCVLNTWEITFELAAACGCYPVLPSVMLNLNARPQSVQENNCSKEAVVILDVKTSQTP